MTPSSVAIPFGARRAFRQPRRETALPCGLQSSICRPSLVSHPSSPLLYPEFPENPIPFLCNFVGLLLWSKNSVLTRIFSLRAPTNLPRPLGPLQARAVLQNPCRHRHIVRIPAPKSRAFSRFKVPISGFQACSAPKPDNKCSLEPPSCRR